MNNLVRLACLLITPLLLAACEPPPTERPLPYSNVAPPARLAIYRLAIHPSYNPEKLGTMYQPLIDHLNRQLVDGQLELEASRDYAAFEQKIAARQPAFLLPNPWQTLQAIKAGYHVIAMAGDASDFKGIILVRQDSGIRQPADLKGKTVSYPSPTALAAAIMPQYFLHTRGLDVQRDIDNAYVGSQESSIMNVYLGKSAAGATWPPPWRLFQKEYPQEAAALKVIWQTPPLVNNSLMVRDDVPDNVRDQVAKLLYQLGQGESDKAILAAMETTRFYAANDRSYDVVATYIERFEKQVRPVESKE